MGISSRELIELVTEIFNEYFIDEERSAVNSANNTLFDIAKNLVNNPKNQFIVYRKLSELIKDNDEDNTDLYKKFISYVKTLEDDLDEELITEVEELLSKASDDDLNAV
ncbi:hypothetical protein COJ90_21000 [Priestia megaterium]|uniref:hypothetical protein n=1 Tax=Priestia megaterium TaxID=1404 RepID=UPI000BF31EC2|nr:hypothetical protein [Priestia megaterium]PFP09384.1 hypothetical protein COJ90_21000 [Priestia megaterium]